MLYLDAHTADAWCFVQYCLLAPDGDDTSHSSATLAVASGSCEAGDCESDAEPSVISLPIPDGPATVEGTSWWLYSCYLGSSPSFPVGEDPSQWRSEFGGTGFGTSSGAQAFTNSGTPPATDDVAAAGTTDDHNDEDCHMCISPSFGPCESVAGICYQ